MTQYLSFLRLQNDHLRDIKFQKVDLHQLLNTIALHNALNEYPLRCADLLQLRELGSPATIHKNYQQLIEMGYLKHSYSKRDGRIRYIELSDKGRAYYAKLTDLMKKTMAKKGIASA